jgi:hypothetical protein
MVLLDQPPIGSRGTPRRSLVASTLRFESKWLAKRHIDVDRDVGSAFEVAKKWWAEK